MDRPLVVTTSPTEFYRADVRLVFTGKFTITPLFNPGEDVRQISIIKFIIVI